MQADKLTEKFDVVLLSCKAFDLEDAIKSLAPAVGPDTAIIPLLNGMRHLETLDGKFGRARVLLARLSQAFYMLFRFLHGQPETIHYSP